ncbi:YbaB/EbfC family nucleoid-associated protein [Actinomadura sp. DC4]|uniref:YbaB/EbfC family nucleoid-associated protein n=1 Tax=Actinomadura sp. DC4 TaxID=3055069 RepID=UPI0025AFC44B|nr:YbaB/EbfC family nucleoid-associated protein [Actinomadura sp. DC4]MDN3352302.1 YbaB/EbfC family nucleoid-associated protein [Actinomadura sp. DC4]
MGGKSADERSLDGLVTADIGADGLLEGLRLSPRALRLGSEALAEHIVSAVRAAQQDQRDKTGEGAREGLDTMVRRLDEMEVQAERAFGHLTSTLDEALRRLE